jgi:hypothetical protein
VAQKGWQRGIYEYPAFSLGPGAGEGDPANPVCRRKGC